MNGRPQASPKNTPSMCPSGCESYLTGSPRGTGLAKLKREQTPRKSLVLASTTSFDGYLIGSHAPRL